MSNQELRANLAKHVNIRIPFMPILATDVQAVGFFDAGAAFDSSRGPSREELRPASVGGGVNLIGFVFQSSPLLFAVEVARRIDKRQSRPTVYGRLGAVF